MIIGITQRQHGVALIQIILLTSIMSVLALYLTNTAREQVSIASWSNEKTLSYVQMYDAQTKVFHALLTKPLGNINNSVPGNDSLDLSKIWNLHNRPFNLSDDVVIQIQDQGGLINIHYPNADIFLNFIQSQGYSYGQAKQLLDTLLDWQDIDSIARLNGRENYNSAEQIRNGALPFVDEIEKIEGVPNELLPILKKNITVYRSSNFNPLNASVELIAALSNELVAQQVDLLRNDNKLSARVFTELTGIRENDGFYFYPSKYIKIKIMSKVGNSKSEKTMFVQIAPTSVRSNPINFLSVKHR